MAIRTPPTIFFVSTFPRGPLRDACGLRFITKDHLASGRLNRVLQDWRHLS
jgi:hypothetical protein